MAHILIHSLKDSLVLLPFFFGTYLVIEILETAAGEHAKKLITGAGKGSVAVGAALGVVPQCGFSAVAAGFYSKGIIGAGAGAASRGQDVQDEQDVHDGLPSRKRSKRNTASSPVATPPPARPCGAELPPRPSKRVESCNLRRHRQSAG